jgi:hypothetical protein
MRIITPTAHRAANSFANPLPLNLKPLLDSRLTEILEIVKDIFPFLSSQQPKKKDEDEDMYEDVEEGTSTSSSSALLPPKLTSALSSPSKVHRPRLMIHGEAEMGQAQAAAALLNHLEEFSIFSLDFATLNSDTSAKTLEEALARVLSEAKRKLPAVIYIPHAPEWWASLFPHFFLSSDYVLSLLLGGEM